MSKDYKFCPLIKKACKGSECMWATKLRGKDPQSEQEIDQELCSIVALPMLLIENTQAAHQVGAAVESLRNNVAEAHQQEMIQRDHLASIIPSLGSLPVVIGGEHNG